MNKLPLYIFNNRFKYENLKFSFLLWNKLHLYFVTFILPVSIVYEIQEHSDFLTLVKVMHVFIEFDCRLLTKFSEAKLR